MRTSLILFGVGISTSLGPCLLFCSPIVLPYIAATRKGWKDGLKAILIFSLSRLSIYLILGFLAGLLGKLLTIKLSSYDYLIFIVGGLLIATIGIIIIFGVNPKPRFCQTLRRQVDDTFKGLVLLGLIVGLLPCAPLLGVLATIVSTSKDPFQGALYGLSFGIGTSLSFLIIFALLASSLSAALFRSHKIFSLFQRGCGFLLYLIGVHLIASAIFR